MNQLLLRETPPNLGAIEKVSKSVHDPGTNCYFVAEVQIQRDDGATSGRSKVPPNLENLGLISPKIFLSCLVSHEISFYRLAVSVTYN